MSAKKIFTLKTNIEKTFDILSQKYKITEKDKCIFMNSFNSNIPMRKKTILTYDQKCKARKQDGTQCSRRHKPNELFCGKHIKNQKYGIFQLKGTSSSITKQKTTKRDEKEDSVIPVNTGVKAKSAKSATSAKSAKSATSAKSAKSATSAKSAKSATSAKSAKGKRGRKPNPKKEKPQEFLTLKSVQIQNNYYYIDKFNILYNPEPINGQYEIIGKLKDRMDTEIYYTTSLT